MDENITEANLVLSVSFLYFPCRWEKEPGVAGHVTTCDTNNSTEVDQRINFVGLNDKDCSGERPWERGWTEAHKYCRCTKCILDNRAQAINILQSVILSIAHDTLPLYVC